MENSLWLMPSYYKKFSCKCDTCRHTCCSSWKIPISEKEYFELIGMECSDNLHHRIETAFEDVKNPTTDHYKYISYNWLGDCPINEKGFCLLHKEKGENSVPKICRLFPRSLKEVNGQLIACCSSSCERIIELLYEDDFQIVKDTLNEEPQIKCEIDEDEIKELLLYNEILKDNKSSLKEGLQKICILVNENEFNNDFSSKLNPLEETMKLLKRFSNSDNMLSKIYYEINNRYQNNYELFNKDSIEFSKTYPSCEKFFRNVINNSLMYETFPFVDKRFDKTKAYKGLCACYGLLKLVSIGYTSIHNSKDCLIDAVSELFHLIDHTPFYYNVNVVLENAAILLKL